MKNLKKLKAEIAIASKAVEAYKVLIKQTVYTSAKLTAKYLQGIRGNFKNNKAKPRDHHLDSSRPDQIIPFDDDETFEDF